MFCVLEHVLLSMSMLLQDQPKIPHFPGPSVIEMINSLLEHVRLSMSEVVTEAPVAVGGSAVAVLVSQEEQQQYQQRLTHALAEYTRHLPDFHKIEAMLFILTKVHY